MCYPYYTLGLPRSFHLKMCSEQLYSVLSKVHAFSLAPTYGKGALSRYSARASWKRLHGNGPQRMYEWMHDVRMYLLYKRKRNRKKSGIRPPHLKKITVFISFWGNTWVPGTLAFYWVGSSSFQCCLFSPFCIQCALLTAECHWSEAYTSSRSSFSWDL